MWCSLVQSGARSFSQPKSQPKMRVPDVPCQIKPLPAICILAPSNMGTRGYKIYSTLYRLFFNDLAAIMPRVQDFRDRRLNARMCVRVCASARVHVSIKSKICPIYI